MRDEERTMKRNMKRIPVLLALSLVSLLSVHAASEDAVVWEEIYNRVPSEEQRVAVMLKIMELKDPEIAPMLIRALDRLLVENIESGRATDRNYRILLARLTVRELGDLKNPEAAETLYRAYVDPKDALLRGEAAVALGKLSAVAYAPRFADDLARINLGPNGPARRDQEILAHSLVEALELMRDPAGYESVFMASMAWYGSATRVRESAERALSTMIDDPTDALAAIIEKNPAMTVRTAALRAAIRSKAGDERKAAIARRSLALGIERATVDKRGLAEAAAFRMEAISSLARVRDRSPESVPLLATAIAMDRRDDASLDESIRAYATLGVNGSDEAARYLASRLEEYGTRETDKMNTARDKTLIRQILSSMRAAKNPLVREALLRAQHVDFDDGILRLVRETLDAVR